MNLRQKTTLAILLAVWIPLSLEIWVRHLDLDQQWIANTLYYQESDLAVQQVSTDPFLHYELAPGGSLEARSRWGDTYSATIGLHGARGNQHDLKASNDVFRLLFFGASTVYGVEVSDHQTLPARLEYHLQKSLPEGPQIEVWNFGTPAYVPAQMARLASRKIQEIPAVEVVVMMPTNRGRRAFLGGSDRLERDYAFFFENDPILWLENFPGPALLPTKVHAWCLAHLASYRWAWISVSHEKLRHSTTSETTHTLSAHEMAAFEKAAAALNIRVFHAGYPPLSDKAGLPKNLQELSPQEQAAALEDRHPPPLILDLHAESLAAELLRENLVPHTGGP